ncbi:uncharacterized protein LOC130504225 [Raphanus sativus]|uniref:Uncharacterized protein LOC130504225 n=1 Tax=Raphanus sativus TaxID=3726 RepID=A0A9W3CT57_RAPSA|nr:uncharacterized protein LOC130504225 [Raphanus sativus]
MEKAKLPFKKRFSRNGSSMEFMVDDCMKEKGARGRFGNSPKVLQCFECKGFGHVQDECTNLLKLKKKDDVKYESGTDSDDGEELKNLVAFTTFVPSSKTKSATGSASASGSSCGGDDDAVSDDDDDGDFDLAGKYERLYENWLKQVKTNSELTKEKVKLEAQVAEALKYASEKEEEARQAGARLAETQKGLKMLNGGTKQLDHLLSIGKNDRCGLGYQGKCSKAECVFVSAGKTGDLATSATEPEVKVSAEKASNGKTAIKTATDVKNATATRTATATATATAPERVSGLKSTSQRKWRPVCHHCGVIGHIRPMCFKLLREKNQMVQAYGAYGMRSHDPICYSCGVQGHIRRECFKSIQGANHGGFGLRNTWSRRYDQYGDGGMGFPPYFGGYRSSY